jgi:hypothetical protein
LANLDAVTNKECWHGWTKMSICRRLLDKLTQMGLRGPKPVDVEHLRGEAIQWASFFYLLRDGVPGLIQHLKWSRVRLQGSAAVATMPASSGKDKPVRSAGMWARRGELLEPPILIPVSKASLKLPERMTTEDGWVIYRPIMPKPAVWEQIKRARTVTQIKNVGRGMGKFQSLFVSSTPWAQNPAGALRRYAEGILAAKRLPNYPKTKRPRSDDKRVEFMAKTMAGLTLGLTAITALKRLSHWRWPKDSSERSLQEFVERSTRRF